MFALQTRFFRNDFKNPYLHNPVEISDFERTKQEELPVWDRIFDFKKYIEHDGPLKVNTFIALMTFGISSQLESHS